MCGIVALAGGPARGAAGAAALDRALARQHHRGPDDQGRWHDPVGDVRLGHNRLAIIDLSVAGRQPMTDVEGRYHLVFNGELYNYRELREALKGSYPFRTATDSEVLIAAWRRWGPACLERTIGFFAFVLWDRKTATLHAVRDRFGIKPLFVHHHADGGLTLASEIRTLHATGVARTPDDRAWARYLALGVHDEGTSTFWQGVERVPAGSYLRWQAGRTTTHRWYDLPSRLARQHDDITVPRTPDAVAERYRALLEASIDLRFRADVPVGINLSGGLDSSTLLGAVHAVKGADSEVRAFTFVCDDERYDELPWVEQMLAHTRHPLTICRLTPDEVPDLATDVAAHQDEPYGGLPTLAYAKLFTEAKATGTTVLLDGQGMDEQWAGYDYYRRVLDGPLAPAAAPTVQGTSRSPLRPGCLRDALVDLAGASVDEVPDAAARGEDDVDQRLRALQLRDLQRTKLPRALRFNDRVSMRASCELREPFLDHRLVELALAQPAHLKIRQGQGKWLLRRIADDLVPQTVVEAPKRPLQTPQREWLRGPLRGWSEGMIEVALDAAPTYFDRHAVDAEWQRFRRAEVDNAFFVWQWINLGLTLATDAAVPAQADASSQVVEA